MPASHPGTPSLKAPRECAHVCVAPFAAPVPGARRPSPMTPDTSTERLLVQVLLRSAHEVLAALETEKDEASSRVREATQKLSLAFAPIWARMSHLELRLRDDGIEWNGQLALPVSEDRCRLARTLLSSGVHGITLVPGVEKKEMALFLLLVDRKRRLDEGGDQDLVLMLFRADLHYLRYTVGAVSNQVGEAVEGATPLGPPTGGAVPAPATAVAPEALAAAVRGDANEPDARRAVVQLEQFDSTLYFLDQNEIEYLREAVEREYAQDHSWNVLSLLLDVLESQDHVEVRTEVIDVLTKILPYLLTSGRFPAVAYLTSELRKLNRTLTLTNVHKAALDRLRASISEADALGQLFHMLDDGSVEPTAAELGALLREMRHDAIQMVLVWMGQLERPSAKAALIEAVEEFFRQWPRALTRMTAASDRRVVQRALAIARKVQHPEMVEPVRVALSSSDASTRRLSVETLAAIGDAPAFRTIARTVADPDAEVRTAVYVALIGRPYRGAEKGLREAVVSPEVEERELSERRALFAAYGTVAGTGAVAVLEPILRGHGGLGRRPSAQTRACAARALGSINTPTARFALESVAKDRDPLVRTAAASALRGDDST